MLIAAGLILGIFLVIFLRHQDGKIKVWEEKIREIYNSEIPRAEKRRKMLDLLK